ncbi:MAG TPA: DUF4402 domain-containing protein [Stellaceae bacterium]|nr:DUF4402 domain-containing protein [Stellaceae bacterium]
MLRLCAAITTSMVACLAASELCAATATGHASVTILRAIMASETAPMSFGQLGPPSGGGAVALSPTSGITGPPGLGVAGTAAAGKFTVTGQPSSAVTISFSSGNVLAGPGPAMALGSFVHNAGATPALDGSGTLTFSVGATLAIGAAQPPGSYSGTYAVTVNY